MKPKQPFFPRKFFRYLISIVLVALVSLVIIPVHKVIEPVNLVMLYLAAVVIAAVYLGQGPAILASVLSVFVFDFFFVDPRLSLTVNNTQYLISFLGLLGVGLIISTITSRLYSQLELIRRREANTTILNSLSRDLTGAYNLGDILNLVVNHLSQAFNNPVVILLPDDDELICAATSASLTLNEQELTAASWAFQNQEPAGRGQTDHPVNLCYIPLSTLYKTIGVLGVELPEGDKSTMQEHLQLLQGFANLAALAIERAHLAEQANQAQVLKNTEQLQATLLNSISHELRTPLATITGTLSALTTSLEISTGDMTARQELLETAYEEALRLNRLVGNLLDMTRLESGAYQLHLEPCDVQDLVGIALSRFGERRHKQSIQVTLADELPLLMIDVDLLTQALVNVLDNAAKYSPEDRPIDIICSQEREELILSVADRGIGIPAEDIDKVFKKFYRGQSDRRTGGIGLGLSISQGIVEAHQGRIWASARPGGGTILSIALKAEKSHAQSSPANKDKK